MRGRYNTRLYHYCGTGKEDLARTAYYGNHERKLDYKGRVGIPDDFLRQGNEWSRAVLVRATSEVTPGVHFAFISAYDADRWQLLLEAAPRLMDLDADELRFFMHKHVGDAATVEVDAMKRITIPERLLEHGGIKRQAPVRILGEFDRIEVWDPPTYEAHIAAMEETEIEVPSLIEVARRAYVKEVS